MNNHFPNSSYDTPYDTPRFLLDRLFCGSRWYFVWGYFREILRGRTLALNNKYDRAEWIESSYRIVKLIEGCGGRIHLTGLQNLHSNLGPTVFIANHMSTLETFALPSIIAPHVPVTFVVKESLVKHAIFGPVMRSRNPIVVKRVNPREDFETVITEGKKLLAEGTSLIIFPQSTRAAEFIPENFNSLGIKLAKAAGAQVMPIALKTDFWGNGKYFKDIGPVDRNKPIYIEFGEAFTVNGNGKAEHQMIVDFISSRLRSWNPSISNSSD